ncbi:MAG: TIGR02587 family membrane protein [Proteobacteria bacterium]|nr:TIGR02587 family membrane protein [Pseudomonadota bacterium]
MTGNGIASNATHAGAELADRDGDTDQLSRRYATSLARAFAGAILFAFPLIMTMEMWWLGFYMDRQRLLILLVVTFALLVPLSRLVGFERTSSRSQDIMDSFVAIGVGVIASATLLLVFGLLEAGMSLDEIVGKIAVQAAPASIGAMVARGQLGSDADPGQQDAKEQQAGYGGQLLLMAAGAVFLAFNVAPTEEMVLIAFKMSPLQGIALVLLSIAFMHAFVYALDFRGKEAFPEQMGFVEGVLSYSIAGYGIAVLVSVYVLWTFGRTDGAAIADIVMMTVVLAFPAALGAAAARLII